MATNRSGSSRGQRTQHLQRAHSATGVRRQSRTGRTRSASRSVRTRTSSRSSRMTRSRPARRSGRGASGGIRPAPRRSIRSIPAPRQSTTRHAGGRRQGMRTGAPSSRPATDYRTGDTVPVNPRRDTSTPPQEPLEFVEVPISGSAGSSYEPDSYTPKANLEKPKRKKRGFFGLFGSG